MLHKMRLSSRIIFTGLIIVMCFSFILCWTYFKIRQSILDAKYFKTQQLVENAWYVLDYYFKQGETNVMSMETAKQTACNVIRQMRYENDNYFWINDTKQIMLMHPFKPELEGTEIGRAHV